MSKLIQIEINSNTNMKINNNKNIKLNNNTIVKINNNTNIKVEYSIFCLIRAQRYATIFVLILNWFD